jgi:DNA-binding transcriptional LysR family regulator
LKRINWETQIGRRIRLRDLHAFFTVVQLGSMGKAAEQLGVSQPAVSKVIADLEHALGVRLVDRNRKGIEPTIYGEALLKRGLVAFDELKQGVRDIEFLADSTTGQVRIECPDTLAATLLPKVIERFSKKYPRVVLHVDTVLSVSLGLPALRDRKYDLLLARLAMPLTNELLSDDWSIETLFDDQLVVAAGQHSRWARQRRIDLAELVGEPWILQPPYTWNFARLSEVFQGRGLALPKASLVTLSMPLIVHFLGNGPFLTAYARSVVRHNLLRELPVELTGQPWPVVVVTLKNRTLTPVVERFIECAREMAKSMAAKPQAASHSLTAGRLGRPKSG